MKRHSNFIALLLSVLMVASQFSVTTFAAAEAVADTQAAAVEQTVDADQDQESAQSESSTEAAEAPAKAEVPKADADKEDAPKAEPEKKDAPEEAAFDQSKTADGVKVTVKADKGVFPADAKLSVKKVSVPKTVDTEDAVKAYAFDISILVGGKEIQPDGKAAVSFTTAEVKNYDTAVYHMDGSKPEELDVTEKGKTATVETGSFSTYVITFVVDGVAVSSAAVSDGESVAKPADPVKSGGVFTGWFKEDGAEYNFSDAVSSDATLYAHWQHNWNWNGSAPDENGVRHIQCRDTDCAYNTAPAELSLILSSTMYYVGDEIEAEALINNDPEHIFSIDNIKYYIGNEEKTDFNTPGNYTVIGDFFAENKSTKAGTVWRQFSVVKETVTPAEGLIYNDENNLIDSETIEPEGTTAVIKYSLESDGTYVALGEFQNKTIPAGTHTVYYKVYPDAESDVALHSGTVEVEIAKRTVDVTADNKEKFESQNDPAFTYSVLDHESQSATGLDDTLEFTGSLQRDPGESANNSPYAIRRGTLELTTAAAVNYEIKDYHDGYLTIKGNTELPEGQNLTYNATEQELVSPGTPTAGSTIQYRIKSKDGTELVGNEFSDGIPSATGAGTYVVEFQMVDSETGVVTRQPEGTTAKIAKADLTITAGDSEITYGEPFDSSAVSVEKEGLQGDDDVNVTISTEYETGKDAGEYPIAPELSSDAVAENYNVTPVNGTLTVKKAEIKYSFSDGRASTEYNGEEQSVTLVAEGLAPEAKVGADVEGDKGTKKGTYTATVTGITGDDARNYTFTVEPLEWEITAKPVTVTWSDTEFTYDGNYHVPTAAVTANDGLIAGDECAVYVDGDQIDAGDNYVATATGLSNENYTLQNDPETTTFSIAKRPITGINNIKALDKVYDATTEADLDWSLATFEGLVKYDTLNVTGATGTFEDPDVGNRKNVEITDVTLGGADIANYVMSDGFTTSAKASITPANATIVWSDGTPFVYDGQMHVPEATATGVNGETMGVEVTGAKKDAGTYTAAAVKLTGDAAKNYNMPTSGVSKEFTIEPRMVDFTVNPETNVYNGEEQAPEILISDAVEGDTVVPVYTIKDSTGNEVTPKDADVYTVTLTGIYEQGVIFSKESTNYKLPEVCDKTYEITKADLTLTPKDINVIYGDEAKDDGYTAAVLMNSDKDGDAPKSGVIEGTAEYSFTGENGTGSGGVYTPGDDVGDYAVTITNVTNDSSGLHSKNYNLIAGSDGKMVLEERPITFKWSTPDSFTYDGKEHEVTAEIENIFSGDKDKPEQLDIKYTDNVNTDAGSYKAVAELTGTKAKNYVIKGSTQEKEWTIDKAKAAIIANSATIYYGDAFTPSGKVTGVIGTDKLGDITYECSYRKNDKHGTYPINVKLENANPNYDITVTNGTLTVKEKNTALVAKATTKGSKKVKISWTAVTGAAKYEIYFARCNAGGKDYSFKKAKTVKAGKLSFTKKKLKKGKCYKFYVVAKDASGKVISKSLKSHFIAGKYNKKNTNAKSLKLTSAKSVTIYKGTATTVTAKPKKAKAKRKFLNADHAELLRFVSSNNAVATVDENGTINGVGTGYCKVFVQTVNGIWQTVEVTVK